jgi:hypothetical protein
MRHLAPATTDSWRTRAQRATGPHRCQEAVSARLAVRRPYARARLARGADLSSRTRRASRSRGLPTPVSAGTHRGYENRANVSVLAILETARVAREPSAGIRRARSAGLRLAGMASLTYAVRDTRRRGPRSGQPPGTTFEARSSHSTRVGALSPASPSAGPSRSLMNCAWSSCDFHTSKTTHPSALAPAAW